MPGQRPGHRRWYLDTCTGGDTAARCDGEAAQRLQGEAALHLRRVAQGGEEEMIYADSSFLCSFYGWDDNSAKAEQIYRADRRRPLIFTAWQRFEVRNAFRLAAHKLRRAGQPVPFDTGNILKRIEEDFDAGRLRHESVDWRENFRVAEALS